MDPKEFPTKGNLILAKNSLLLAKQGYELMDKKRNILVRELMGLVEQAKEVQNEIDKTFSEAYQALQKANIEMGISNIENLAFAIPIEESVQIKLRSIMGTEIPLVTYEPDEKKLAYAFYATRESLDAARSGFEKVKRLIIKLSTIEISAYRLAGSVRKTQKRANALQNITIPKYTNLTKSMTNALEEKEREEFTRLKVIKRRKNMHI